MTIFKTSAEILDSIWQDTVLDRSTQPSLIPNNSDWDYSRTPKFSDVKIWETIYTCGGSISVYAAWDPFIEYYIIVHDFFKNHQIGIEEFYGITASEKVTLTLKEYGIELPKDRVWVNIINMPEFD
jgi:hypothetical protein